jgi:hypothetical protein
MHTILTATEINRLAQRLTQTPLGRSASVTAAAERFQRLLAAKIGPARAAEAAKAILAAPGFETAEGRLVAEIEGAAPDMVVDPAPAADPAPSAITGPAPPSKPAAEPTPQRRRRDADLEARACRDHRDSGFPSEVICDSLCGGIYGGQLWASRIL